jgi:hypothetical protein
MRIQNEQSRGMSRAGDLRERGFFGSAASAEIRAEIRAEERADRIGARNAATDQFGGSNMGEAFRNYRDQMARAGEKAVSERDFKAWAEDQAKTERQREDAEAAAGGGGGGLGAEAKDPMGSIAADIGDIKNILTKADGIHDRLPIRVLAT